MVKRMRDTCGKTPSLLPYSHLTSWNSTSTHYVTYEITHDQMECTNEGN